MHWRRKWQPTPVFLPGESQGRGSLVGCRLRSRKVAHDYSDLATGLLGGRCRMTPRPSLLPQLKVTPLGSGLREPRPLPRVPPLSPAWGGASSLGMLGIKASCWSPRRKQVHRVCVFFPGFSALLSWPPPCSAICTWWSRLCVYTTCRH